MGVISWVGHGDNQGEAPFPHALHAAAGLVESYFFRPFPCLSVSALRSGGRPCAVMPLWWDPTMRVVGCREGWLAGGGEGTESEQCASAGRDQGLWDWLLF